MQAKEAVGKARPRLSMLRDASRAEGASRLPHPTAGLEGDPPLSPPSAVGCASRSSCRPPPTARLPVWKGEAARGEPGRGAGDAGKGGGGPPPGGAVQHLTPAPASPGVGARRPTRDGRSGAAGTG